MAKQELNAFDVVAAVRELQALVGTRFDKAFQPQREEVLLRFRASQRLRDETNQDDGAVLPTESSKVDVAIGVGRYVCVTALPRNNPPAPSQFVMTLRKHLNGARLTSVHQHGFDRVVTFELERKEGAYALVAEFFANGNLILVHRGRIVSALIPQSWASRDVRPGAEFRMPPARADPRELSLDDFAERFNASSADVVRTLATEMGLGGVWGEEIAARAGLDKNQSVADTSPEQVAALHAALQSALTSFGLDALQPVVVTEGEEKVDVSPVALARHAGATTEAHPTFMAALDRYFSPAVTVERIDPRLTKVEEAKTKVERMLKAQESAMKKFETEGEQCRVNGDLLYAHFDTIQRLATRVLEGAKAHGWDQVKDALKAAKKDGKAEAKAVVALDASQAKATLELPDLEGKPQRLTIDLRKTVQENANAYYARSKKMRDKLVGAAEAMKITRQKLADLEEKGVTIVEAMEAHKSKAPPTKRLWFDGYRWFLSTDGLLVLAGKDAGSNERLVKKHLGDNDRYVHANVSGAPSCVVKAGDGPVPDTTLAEAADFAVSMSRAWTSGVAAGEAYWVTPTQVSKTPNPGEYVGRGAFIIRGKRTNMRARTLLAVGEVEVEGVRKVMCGPVVAVQARAQRYLIIEPGQASRNKLANRLARVFEVPVEEVQGVLPPADVNVVEEHGMPEDEA